MRKKRDWANDPNQANTRTGGEGEREQKAERAYNFTAVFEKVDSREQKRVLQKKRKGPSSWYAVEVAGSSQHHTVWPHGKARTSAHFPRSVPQYKNTQKVLDILDIFWGA